MLHPRHWRYQGSGEKSIHCLPYIQLRWRLCLFYFSSHHLNTSSFYPHIPFYVSSLTYIFKPTFRLLEWAIPATVFSVLNLMYFKIKRSTILTIIISHFSSCLQSWILALMTVERAPILGLTDLSKMSCKLSSRAIFWVCIEYINSALRVTWLLETRKTQKKPRWPLIEVPLDLS